MHDEDMWPSSIPKKGFGLMLEQSGAESAGSSTCRTGQGLQAQESLPSGKKLWVNPGVRQAICLLAQQDTAEDAATPWSWPK